MLSFDPQERVPATDRSRFSHDAETLTTERKTSLIEQQFTLFTAFVRDGSAQGPGEVLRRCAQLVRDFGLTPDALEQIANLVGAT